MEFVDIGANLTHEAFGEDRADVLARALDSGVERLVVTGADAASSRAALDLARQHPQRLRATAGVHPHGADAAEANIRATLETLAGHRLVTAVGEAGLDFNRDFSPRAVQERLFEQQLELAATLGLPVFAH
jgi:TatD DNase family protein